MVSGSATGPKTETIYDDQARTVKVRKQLDATNWDEATTYMDSLGRAIKTVAKDSQGDIIVETKYDLLGRVQMVSNPYRTGDTVYWNLTEYDAAGRAKQSREPIENQNPASPTGNVLGTTTYGISTLTGYVGTVLTTTDASGRKGRSITNALGQLLRVDEPTAIGGTADADLGPIGTPAQPTKYTYDAYGKMVKVEQGVQTRYFKYDSLGRLIRVNQPEQEYNSSLDLPDSFNPTNHWTAGFTYDVLGNVLTATDAKGTVITNTYDRASRVLTRSYSNEPSGVNTPAVSFLYDGKGLDSLQSPNWAKGKLTKVDNAISQTRYKLFDNFGRLTSTEQRTPLDGETTATAIPRVSTFTYNLGGSLTQETYPSGRVVKVAYESDGDLMRISGRTGIGRDQIYANSFSYMPDGKIERLKLGNGLWEKADFNSRLQVRELDLGHGVNTPDVWKLTYEYGELNTDGSVNTDKNTGNIAKQTVSFEGLAQPFIQTYKYDALYRLKEGKETRNGTQTWIQQFDYDLYGNRTALYQNVGGQVLNTTPAVDVNSNRFSSQSFHYDKNGNITQDTGPNSQNRTIVFNGDNKQTQVKDANNQPVGTYYYDGEGKRVKKVTDLETVVYVYSSGKLVAEYSTATPPSNPTISYTATDLLGSPRVLTNSLGVVVSRRDFMPFGEELFADGQNRTTNGNYSQTGEDSVRKRFTGYEKDMETGLDFAEARMYENRYGRFTAIDPLLTSGQSSTPQSFNRFTYVMNNPIKLTDKSGLQAATNPNGDTLPVIEEPGIIQMGITRAYELVKRFSDYLTPVSATDRVPAFESISGSDPLQNLNYGRFNSVLSGARGSMDEDSLNRQLIGNKGGSVSSVLQRTGDSYEMATKIGVANLAFQNLTLTFQASFLPGSSSSVSDNRGFSLRPAAENIQFPQIKAGSSGGSGKFSRYISVDVRRQSAAENPSNICVFCRQPTFNPHLDHAIPFSAGGNNTIDNIQVTCAFCNLSKGVGEFPVNPSPGYEGPFPGLVEYSKMTT